VYTYIHECRAFGVLGEKSLLPDCWSLDGRGAVAVGWLGRWDLQENIVSTNSELPFGTFWAVYCRRCHVPHAWIGWVALWLLNGWYPCCNTPFSRKKQRLPCCLNSRHWLRFWNRVFFVSHVAGRLQQILISLPICADVQNGKGTVLFRVFLFHLPDQWNNSW
jgi:hypothetical protein